MSFLDSAFLAKIMVLTLCILIADFSFPCCRHTFATLSFIAEIFLFLYVGMDALDIEKWKLASSRYLSLLE